MSNAKIGFMRFENINEALECAKIIYNSTFCPVEKKSDKSYHKWTVYDIVCAAQYGIEIGLSPMQAVQEIRFVKGKPTLKADAARALCLSSPLIESIVDQYNEETMEAVCIVKRKDMDEPIIGKFSREQAIKAELWGKGLYITYPDRMIQMRARGFGLRDGCADILKGIITKEEADDYGDSSVLEEVKNGTVEAPKVKVSKIEKNSDSESDTLMTDNDESEVSITKETLDRIIKLSTYLDMDKELIDKLLAHFNVKSFSSLSEYQGIKVCEWLNKKILEEDKNLGETSKGDCENE